MKRVVAVGNELKMTAFQIPGQADEMSLPDLRQTSNSRSRFSISPLSRRTSDRRFSGSDCALANSPLIHPV